MIVTASPYLKSLLASGKEVREGIAFPLRQVTDVADFEARFTTLFEQPVTDESPFYRIEENGVILAWLTYTLDEEDGPTPAILFKQVEDPTPYLGYNPADLFENQVKQLAEFTASSVTNPHKSGRLQRVVGGYRFTVGQRQKKDRSRAMNVDKYLAGKRAGRRGLATRIQKAKQWHQSFAGRQMHNAQARYQSQTKEAVERYASFLSEHIYRRFHKGTGVIDIAQPFHRVEDQPVNLRVFMSGLDLALGETSVFVFDKNNSLSVFPAKTIVQQARIDEGAVLYRFPDAETRDRVQQIVAELGFDVLSRDDNGMWLRYTQQDAVNDAVRTIQSHGGKQIELTERDIVDIDESHLHESLMDISSRFGYGMLEQMPCGMVYIERQSGEVVVSVCEHLLTKAQLEALRTHFKLEPEEEIKVYEDLYDPKRMLRECTLSVATEGTDIQQVGPRSWAIDGNRIALYSPLSKFVRVYPLNEIFGTIKKIGKWIGKLFPRTFGSGKTATKTTTKKTNKKTGTKPAATKPAAPKPAAAKPATKTAPKPAPKPAAKPSAPTKRPGKVGRPKGSKNKTAAEKRRADAEKQRAAYVKGVARGIKHARSQPRKESLDEMTLTKTEQKILDFLHTWKGSRRWTVDNDREYRAAVMLERKGLVRIVRIGGGVAHKGIGLFGRGGNRADYSSSIVVELPEQVEEALQESVDFRIYDEQAASDEPSDMYMTLRNLATRNNGLWKSDRQGKFLLSQIKQNGKLVGQSDSYAHDVAKKFAPDGTLAAAYVQTWVSGIGGRRFGKNSRRMGYMYFLDNFGIIREVKTDFGYDTEGGSWVKGHKITFERPESVAANLPTSEDSPDAKWFVANRETVDKVIDALRKDAYFGKFIVELMAGEKPNDKTWEMLVREMEKRTAGYPPFPTLPTKMEITLKVTKAKWEDRAFQGHISSVFTFMGDVEGYAEFGYINVGSESTKKAFIKYLSEAGSFDAIAKAAVGKTLKMRGTFNSNGKMIFGKRVSILSVTESVDGISTLAEAAAHLSRANKDKRIKELSLKTVGGELSLAKMPSGLFEVFKRKNGSSMLMGFQSFGEVLETLAKTDDIRIVQLDEAKFEEEFQQFIQWVDENTTQLDEGLFDLLKKIPSALSGAISFLKELATNTGVKLSSILSIFKNKTVYKFFAAIGWSFSSLYDLLKKGYKAYVTVLDAVADYIAKNPAVQWTEAQLKKLDDFLQAHPMVRKIGGVAVAALLIYIWFTMTFTGDPIYDFDMTDMLLALGGSYSLSKLFAGKAGVKLLLLFATGAITGLSFPWPGAATAKFAFAIISTIAKWLKIRLTKTSGDAANESLSVATA